MRILLGPLLYKSVKAGSLIKMLDYHWASLSQLINYIDKRIDILVELSVCLHNFMQLGQSLLGTVSLVLILNCQHLD